MQDKNTNHRRPIYMLVALLVAVAMWFYVDEFGYNGGARPAEVTITDIPITYIGEASLADRGMMLLEEDTSTSLDFTFSAARRLVVQLQKEDIRVTVNLSDVNNFGVQNVRYQVSFSDRRFSDDMIQERSISTATVNISELKSKTVEVRCELMGNVADGYSAGQLQLSQEELEIRGQAEDIDRISYAKIVFDIGENATESISRDLVFQYYDKKNQLVSSNNIHPTVEFIQAKLPVYVTKELRLVVDFQDAPGARLWNVNYTIQPSTIMVSGDASTLRNVDTITLGQLDLLDLVDNGASSHTYPIIIPDGCQNHSGVTRATMEIEFKDMVSTNVVATQFKYINPPSGRSVDILTEELRIAVFGTEEDVAAVTDENIYVTVDLSNYSAVSGTYTVPAEVTIATPGDIGITGVYQLQVTIRETPPETPEIPDSPESPVTPEESGNVSASQSSVAAEE